METFLSYQDVCLVPRYGILASRSAADITSTFLDRKLAAPWMPANMSSVINRDIAKWLAFAGYPYIMHRFGDTLAFVRQAQDWPLISISVGMKDEDRELLRTIADEGLPLHWITVDVAHGHCAAVKEMLQYIRSLPFPYPHLAARPKVIAGNVATPQGVLDLAAWGADAVKIGIAGGAVCSTRHQTGFHVPMFDCVRACAEVNTHRATLGQAPVPLIADGGVRHPGDIAKALVAGAHLVMAGSIFAACTDAPSQKTDSTGKLRRYYGSASEHQKGHKQYVEGFAVDLPANHLTYAEKYEQLSDGLRSAVSYGGGTDLSCFQGMEWVRVGAS